jgi:hypothetical protein
MAKTIIALLLLISGFAAASVAMGAPYLEFVLPGGLPAGNALVAVGLCAAASAAIGLSSRGTWLRTMSMAALMGAVSWLPVSALMAGNLALNFHGKWGDVWMVFSLAVLVHVAIALSASLLAAGLNRFPTV